MSFGAFEHRYFNKKKTIERKWWDRNTCEYLQTSITLKTWGCVQQKE